MSNYFVLINHKFINRLKNLAIIFLPLFIFMFSGQAIYASMNSESDFHKEGARNAVKPLVVEHAPTIDIWYGDEQQFGQIGNPQQWINNLGMDGNKVASRPSMVDDEPPIITNITVYTFPTKAIIQWQTNELATSQVNFGTSASYELGLVYDNKFVITHTIILLNLNPDTTYHYQITSVNGDTISAYSPDATFTTPILPVDNSGIVSDDFNAGTLNSNVWTFVNPVGDGVESLNGTELLISVPADVEHEIWQDGNRSARVVQAANDTDFEIEAKFASTLTAPFQVQGILVEEDADNFLNFDFYHDGDTYYIWVASFVDGLPETPVIWDKPLDGWGAPMFMQVTRVGNDWYLWLSLDGVDWELETFFTHNLIVNQVGVYAANASSDLGSIPANTAVVDYFFNTASPIDPEDANATPLILTTNSVGDGSIAKNPNNTNFAFGDVVTLTANANAGSSFNHWSGGVVGSSNPITVTMDSDKTVTSNFISDAVTTYVLTPSIIGNGSVTVFPDKVSYLPGEVVTVTAVPDADWTFNGWSGDIVSSDVVTTITMDSNKAITATFIVYTLTINTVGGGNVTVIPDKASYLPGETVTLTAVADSGWVFNSWTGSNTGSTSPKTITMNGNKVITATFIESSVQTYNLTISKIGNGNVTVVPDKAGYLPGEVVTVTAVPDANWAFNGWSGSLVGNNATRTITMDSNKAITATFITYHLTINKVGSGNVTVSPNKASYLPGEVVTVTAVPNVGWQFTGWSGASSNTNSSIPITMNANKNLTATFRVLTFLPMVIK